MILLLAGVYGIDYGGKSASTNPISRASSGTDGITKNSGVFITLEELQEQIDNGSAETPSPVDDVKNAPAPAGWTLLPITEAPYVAPIAPTEQVTVELPRPVSKPLEETAAPVDDSGGADRVGIPTEVPTAQPSQTPVTTKPPVHWTLPPLDPLAPPVTLEPETEPPVVVTIAPSQGWTREPLTAPVAPPVDSMKKSGQSPVVAPVTEAPLAFVSIAPIGGGGGAPVADEQNRQGVPTGAPSEELARDIIEAPPSLWAITPLTAAPYAAPTAPYFKGTAAPLAVISTVLPTASAPWGIGPGGDRIGIPTAAPSTDQPDSSIGSHPICHVCGRGKEMSFPNAEVSFIGASKPLKCSSVESGGLTGFVDEAFCSVLPGLIGPCGCVASDQSLPATPSPSQKVPLSQPPVDPTPPPTKNPTPAPTPNPTENPTPDPTPNPTEQPTPDPTPRPTFLPTPAPTTSAPSVLPEFPTTDGPTSSPTPNPTFEPTPMPTIPPTTAPSAFPTGGPSSSPPTESPTMLPTRNPTPKPTEAPSAAPTAVPSSNYPTSSPTLRPSIRSGDPTPGPTNSPYPSVFPTPHPTQLPSKAPTFRPTHQPTGGPTPQPTPDPTPQPTPDPTPNPTPQPTPDPTPLPTTAPTPQPTPGPTVKPGAPTSLPSTSFPSSTPSTSFPSPDPTVAPSMMATNKPSPGPTLTPVVEPTLEAPVDRTVVSTNEPTLEPTSIPPTNKATSKPALAWQELSALGVLMEMSNTAPLSPASTDVWQRAVSDHVEAEVQRLDNLSSEQIRITVKLRKQSPDFVSAPPTQAPVGIESAATLRGQGGGRERILQEDLLEIKFDVDIFLQTSETGQDINTYLLGAFSSIADKETFRASLQKNDGAAFSDTNSIGVTVPPPPTTIERSPSDANTGLIAGMVAVGVSGIALIAFFLYSRQRKRKLIVESDDDEDLHDPPITHISGSEVETKNYDYVTHVDVEGPDDVSTLGDPIPPGLAREVLDPSVADSTSLDYDFQRKYRRDGPSVASASIDSATQGSATIPGTTSLYFEPDDDTLGAQYFAENQFNVDAPPGMLGLVLESSADGVPTVHAIKSTSPLVTQVKVGDRLLSVDGDDVTVMLASDVSRLIAAKRDFPIRRFVFTRSSPAPAKNLPQLPVIPQEPNSPDPTSRHLLSTQLPMFPVEEASASCSASDPTTEPTTVATGDNGPRTEQPESPEESELAQQGSMVEMLA